MKFKTGDRVRVKQEKDIDTSGNPGWTSYMDATSGKEYILDKKSSNCWRLPGEDGDLWSFREDWLEKIEETPKFKVGDKVRFKSLDEIKKSTAILEWLPQMNSRAGQKRKVIEVTLNSVRIENCDERFLYSKKWVNKAEEFEVGDEVKILTNPKDLEVNPYCWVQSMDQYRGKKGVISSIHESPYEVIGYKINFGDAGHQWNFRKHWFRAASSEEKTTPEPVSRYRLTGNRSNGDHYFELSKEDHYGWTFYSSYSNARDFNDVDKAKDALQFIAEAKDLRRYRVKSLRIQLYDPSDDCWYDFWHTSTEDQVFTRKFY